MSKGSHPTWFATLRRDRGPFALVGALVLLLGILQPLTAAQASDGGQWVICTVYGAGKPVEASDLPSAGLENCPVCLAGNSCAGAPAHKARLSPDPAFPAPQALAARPVACEPDRSPKTRPGDPPPAIRAPPLPA